MKKNTITLCLSVICFTSFSQAIDLQKKSSDIVAEGKKLYESEMASWYGTDIFLEKCPSKDIVGGYFSYCDNNVVKIFSFLKDYVLGSSFQLVLTAPLMSKMQSLI